MLDPGPAVKVRPCLVLSLSIGESGGESDRSLVTLIAHILQQFGNADSWFVGRGTLFVGRGSLPTARGYPAERAIVVQRPAADAPFLQA